MTNLLSQSAAYEHNRKPRTFLLYSPFSFITVCMLYIYTFFYYLTTILITIL
nr:MAG TPA: hypothetical protein [Caudoviricetes sp.]